jgi:hypothetical protein
VKGGNRSPWEHKVPWTLILFFSSNYTDPLSSSNILYTAKLGLKECLLLLPDKSDILFRSYHPKPWLSLCVTLNRVSDFLWRSLSRRYIMRFSHLFFDILSQVIPITHLLVHGCPLEYLDDPLGWLLNTPLKRVCPISMKVVQFILFFHFSTYLENVIEKWSAFLVSLVPFDSSSWVVWALVQDASVKRSLLMGDAATTDWVWSMLHPAFKFLFYWASLDHVSWAKYYWLAPRNFTWTFVRAINRASSWELTFPSINFQVS